MQCNLAAAGGTYVDPDGQLIVYGTEHRADGPGARENMKMMEFRSRDPKSAVVATAVDGDRRSRLRQRPAEVHDVELHGGAGRDQRVGDVRLALADHVHGVVVGARVRP